MALLKYFKPVNSKTLDNTLPDPDSSLNEVVPSTAIAKANETVSKVLQQSSSSGERGPYLKLTPAQRYQIGKRAAEHGTTASIRYFKTKFPDLELKETTVRRLKCLYLSELQKKPLESRCDFIVQELIPKKRGRPLILGEELDKQVREYLLETRRHGGIVNTAVTIATGTGIVMSQNPSLLAGDGKVELTKDWAKYLLNRMGFVKRKATTKAKVDVKEFEEIKKLFLLDVKNVAQMDEISEDMIVNWDQTGVNYVPVSSWTMEEEGSKRIELIGKDDKRQLTVLFAGSLSGDLLPIQIIYQGKSSRCLPKFNFPDKWHVTYTVNHWANENTMEDYINMIIVPYFEQTRLRLNLATNARGLVLFDNFNGQCTEKIFQLLEENDIDFVIIPANCTDRLQPLDLSFNKAAKMFLRSRFQDWFAQQVAAQKRGEKPVEPVDLRLSMMKPLGAQWMVELFDHFKAKSSIICNDFKAAGIADCL